MIKKWTWEMIADTLIKEFQKNWVLFLMLIPLCVFFLINSYLPMIGIYFAMERFVKKKVCRV